MKRFKVGETVTFSGGFCKGFKTGKIEGVHRLLTLNGTREMFYDIADSDGRGWLDVPATEIEPNMTPLTRKFTTGG